MAELVTRIPFLGIHIVEIRLAQKGIWVDAGAEWNAVARIAIALVEIREKGQLCRIGRPPGQGGSEVDPVIIGEFRAVAAVLALHGQPVEELVLTVDGPAEVGAELDMLATEGRIDLAEREIERLLGDSVYEAAGGVQAEQGGRGALQDFNPLQAVWLEPVPDEAGNAHRQGIAVGAQRCLVEAANEIVVVAVVTAVKIADDARGVGQRFINVLDPALFHLLLGDNGYGCRHVEDRCAGLAADSRVIGDDRLPVSGTSGSAGGPWPGGRSIRFDDNLVELA